jgi:hypothetical protein
MMKHEVGVGAETETRYNTSRAKPLVSRVRTELRQGNWPMANAER